MPQMIVDPRTFSYFMFYEPEDSVLKEITRNRQWYFIIKEIQHIFLLIYENLFEQKYWRKKWGKMDASTLSFI